MTQITNSNKVPTRSTNHLAIASFILAVVGLLSTITTQVVVPLVPDFPPSFFFAGIGFGFIGVILGIFSLTDQRLRKGLGIAAIVIGSLAAGLPLCTFVAFAV